MKREKLDELDILIRDLRMAMDIKEQIEQGMNRGLIDFADGEKIDVPIPEEAKKQLGDKIISLTSLLKEKISQVN